MKTLSLTKWGNSQGLRLSKDLLNQLGWRENEKVEVVVNNHELSLKPAKSKRRSTVTPIEELFKDYDISNYTVESIDWGEDVGKEIIND